MVFFCSSKKFWLLFGQKLKERSNNTQLKCCFRFSLAFLLYLLLYSKESKYCFVVFKTRRPAHLHSQYDGLLCYCFGNVANFRLYNREAGEVNM